MKGEGTRLEAFSFGKGVSVIKRSEMGKRGKLQENVKVSHTKGLLQVPKVSMITICI